MSENKKTAVVTGASRGIGRAVAIELAGRGMNVVVNYAGSEKAAEETVALCKEKGVEAISICANVSDAAACEELIAKTKEHFGSVDVLVNNAGVTRDGLIMSMKEEDIDAVLDTNLKGTLLTSKFAAKIMLRQKSGKIINMSSVVGIHGNPGQTNYSASKGGVIAFTKSLAKELASRGITVNAVAPGFIETDMTQDMPDAAKEASKKAIPMGHIGKPEDIAKAVAFLASDDAAYITGQVLGVDGGMGM